MGRSYFILILFLSICISILANEEKIEKKIDIDQKIKKCFNIQNDSSRLICYDMLASSIIKRNKKLESIGKWNISLKKIPHSDEKKVVLSLDADIGHGKWNKPVTLQIECLNNQKYIYIDWKDYIQNAPIKLKIDNRFYNKKRWKILRDGKLTKYSGKHEVLIKRLKKANKLSATATTINSKKIHAIFDVSALNIIYESIKSLCEKNSFSK